MPQGYTKREKGLTTLAAVAETGSLRALEELAIEDSSYSGEPISLLDTVWRACYARCRL
jgi:hypothetical protein